jgi:hypothetical protein
MPPSLTRPRDEHDPGSRVDRVTPELVEAIGLLTAQLSSTAAAPTSADLDDVASPVTTLFLARSYDKIVGMFTLLLLSDSHGVAWSN